VASIVYDFGAYPTQAGTNTSFILDQGTVTSLLQKNPDGTLAQDIAGNYTADPAAVKGFISTLASVYDVPGCSQLNQDVEAQYLTAAITLGSNDAGHIPSVTVTNTDVQQVQNAALQQKALMEQQAMEAMEQQAKEQAEREAKVKAEQEELKAKQEKAVEEQKEAEQKAQEKLEAKEEEKPEEKTEETNEQTPANIRTGQSFIDINITDQKLTYYVDGVPTIVSDIVTGNARAHHDTPNGTYQIYAKQRNRTLKGDDYEAFVKYWMPFTGHYGIHDASWRGSFGGEIYKTNGSHGCVNLPGSTAAALYDAVSVGTTVLIHM
jgi:lipoprotein-anchoring transpeptidase ErfK/SrfK